MEARGGRRGLCLFAFKWLSGLREKTGRKDDGLLPGELIKKHYKTVMANSSCGGREVMMRKKSFSSDTGLIFKICLLERNQESTEQQ